MQYKNIQTTFLRSDKQNDVTIQLLLNYENGYLYGECFQQTVRKAKLISYIQTMIKEKKQGTKQPEVGT